MKKSVLPVAFFAMFSATSAIAACPTPEYPAENDGICLFDVLCFLGRSGDMDIRDGVKLQDCVIEEHASGAPRSGAAPEEEQAEVDCRVVRARRQPIPDPCAAH